jgi:hypothetical protein
VILLKYLLRAMKGNEYPEVIVFARDIIFLNYINITDNTVTAIEKTSSSQQKYKKLPGTLESNNEAVHL